MTAVLILSYTKIKVYGYTPKGGHSDQDVFVSLLTGRLLLEKRN